MHRLVNSVRGYEWGSTTYLPDLLGQPRTGRPQAELWIGAHESQPSMIDSGESTQESLLELVSSSPEQQLGRDAAAKFSGRLPFLLKVLAVEQPLSLQLHPDALRAEVGFRAEEAAGVNISAPERTYKDPYHKPELTYAVTAFETLCGFRQLAQSVSVLTGLARHAPQGSFFAAALADLSVTDEHAAVHAVTARALELPREEAGRCLDIVRRICPELGDDTAHAAAHLAARYPDDPGVLVTLLMNMVRLEPGQALYVRPGTLHSHLHGIAVEVQAGSDNTIRGGLTSKYVAVKELLAGLDCSVGPVALEPQQRISATEVVFRPPVDEFELSVLRTEVGATTSWDASRPRAVLVLDGEIHVRKRGRTITLAQGGSLFVAADAEAIEVWGTGSLVAATTGLST